LDLKKDEPIQFGLVKFDKNFNILDKFSTYIKPKKQISELKDIVSFIT
jgi:DNA polymerase III epsilon subunit-like protein